MTDLFADFAESLTREDKAANTIASYLRDLRHFAHWFSQSNGQDFSPTLITPMDTKDYRRYMMVQVGAKPATVNRRLAALHRFCRWAKGRGLLEDDPTEGIKGIDRERHLAPKALSRNQVHALIRTVERHGSRRDLAIIETLRHTGVRVGELVGVRPDDGTMSQRKGNIVVRWGKGGRYRELDLNSDVPDPWPIAARSTLVSSGRCRSSMAARYPPTAARHPSPPPHPRTRQCATRGRPPPPAA